MPMTGMPSFDNKLLVPPVETISTPNLDNSRQNSTIPRLSDTLTSALLILTLSPPLALSEFCKILFYHFISREISENACTASLI
jgi:hypothetical protein